MFTNIEYVVQNYIEIAIPHKKVRNSYSIKNEKALKVIFSKVAEGDARPEVALGSYAMVIFLVVPWDGAGLPLWADSGYGVVQATLCFHWGGLQATLSHH